MQFYNSFNPQNQCFSAKAQLLPAHHGKANSRQG
jgi:hypothetical protein